MKNLTPTLFCCILVSSKERYRLIWISQSINQSINPSLPYLHSQHPFEPTATMMSLSVKKVLLFHSLWAAQAFSGRTFLSSSLSSSSSRLYMSSTATANTIKFSKYEGLGNDFILIDDRDKKSPSITPEAAAKLCDRNFGVGGDGVIFALQPPDADHDFTMRIYNSDGSEPEMCGNGIRCFAQFLKDLGEAKETYQISTLAGLIVPVMNPDSTITVNMGECVLDGPTIPTTLTPNADENSVLEQDITDNNGKTWKISTVSMGNPHAIIFVDDLEKDVDLAVDGPALETASVFPAKTNVEFVQVMAPDHLKWCCGNAELVPPWRVGRERALSPWRPFGPERFRKKQESRSVSHCPGAICSLNGARLITKST
jgi:diaminopimelate epimerase